MLDRIGREITREQRDLLLGDPTYTLVAHRAYELEGLEIYVLWTGSDDHERTYEIALHIHSDVMKVYTVRDKVLYTSVRQTEAKAAEFMEALEDNIVRGNYQYMVDGSILREWAVTK